MATTPDPQSDPLPGHGEQDPAATGVTPTDADGIASPEQPPMDDDASGLPDRPSDRLGDFA